MLAMENGICLSQHVARLPQRGNSNKSNNDSSNIIPQRVQLFAADALAKLMLILKPFVFIFVALFVVVCLREWNTNATRSEWGRGYQQVFSRFLLLKKTRKETKRNETFLFFPFRNKYCCVICIWKIHAQTTQGYAQRRQLSTLQFQLICCCCCF